MAIVLVLEGRVLPGRQHAMEDFLREARPYYESPGDITMRFMWHVDDTHRFREEFAYRTEAAYRQDDERVQRDPEMRAWLQRWRALLDGEISVTVWRDPLV